MAKKGKEGTTFKQRLNGNEYALKYAEELNKKYDVKDILTAGVIAISWLSSELREKVFDVATGAKTGIYIQAEDIINLVSSDKCLSGARKRFLLKYFEQIQGHQQKTLIAQSSNVLNKEKSG